MIDRLLVDGKISEIDRAKNDVTYLPAGRSLIASEHWDNLKESLSDEEDTEEVQEAKVQVALKVDAVVAVEEKTVDLIEIKK